MELPCETKAFLLFDSDRQNTVSSRTNGLRHLLGIYITAVSLSLCPVGLASSAESKMTSRDSNGVEL